MKYHRIGFAGSGNLAWHLAQDLEKAGHFIPVIYSRNPENAALLASQLYDTTVISEPDFSEFNLEVLILAVSDDAIERLSEEILVNENTIVVHTSGAKSMESLDFLKENYGVFYPLQSFTKEKAIDLSDVPFCIEASSTRVHEVLFTIARSLSSKVVVLDSEQRKVLHLAAVFANNFTNHMLFWAKTLLDAEGLDFNLLKPLAKETIEKAFFLTPELAQTGPARRGDYKTMKAHLDQIEANPELTELYQRLSKSIQFNS
ncbi:MAG TPA: DUF2520 domain-containing protein [Catalimonadaceae bacterium]|nr:DUF2520 domain-containing protein [Catalimonadaceae bacterium]HPI10091.1 DUF2520 domain-containing protein [Catalimonadaceae bacterium]